MDKKKRCDIILIAVCLFAALASLLTLRFCSAQGAVAVVKADGERIGEYPLSKDITVPIVSENGTNTLVIKDGKAYVTDASCPDGLCEKMHSVSRNGESIVCLPNKVVITVEGGEEGVDLEG